MIEKLLTAEDNRIKCTCCSKKIWRGEKYFRDAQQKWRSSHTVNICQRCITKMFIIVNMDEKEVGKIRKDLILEHL